MEKERDKKKKEEEKSEAMQKGRFITDRHTGDETDREREKGERRRKEVQSVKN